MAYMTPLHGLVARLDPAVGLAWVYTRTDLARECAGQSGGRRAVTYVRYVTAFASLLVLAAWRHETRQAGGALGALYAATGIAAVTVGASLQMWFPSARPSGPYPLPLRVRAGAVMALGTLVLMGHLLPVVVRLITGIWTFAPVGLHAFQRTVAENLMLTAAFTAQGQLHVALIVLPALALPFAMGAVALCAPFVAHGIEHRRPLPNVRTGLTLTLLNASLLLVMGVAGTLTFAARWPVAAMTVQSLLVALAGAAAMRGLMVAAASSAVVEVA